MLYQAPDEKSRGTLSVSSSRPFLCAGLFLHGSCLCPVPLRRVDRMKSRRRMQDAHARLDGGARAESTRGSRSSTEPWVKNYGTPAGEQPGCHRVVAISAERLSDGSHVWCSRPVWRYTSLARLVDGGRSCGPTEPSEYRRQRPGRSAPRLPFPSRRTPPG